MKKQIKMEFDKITDDLVEIQNTLASLGLLRKHIMKIKITNRGISVRIK